MFRLDLENSPSEGSQQKSQSRTPSPFKSPLKKLNSFPLPFPQESSIPELNIFFGSQTGTAERFATLLSEQASNLNIQNNVINLQDFVPEQFLKSKLSIFLVATFGEGQPTQNAVKTYKYLKSTKREQLRSAQIKGTQHKMLLSQMGYSVFGLGSSHYEHFNQMGKNFDSFLSELGGQRVCELGLGDDAGNIEADFNIWKSKLWNQLSYRWNPINSLNLKNQLSMEKKKSVKSARNLFEIKLVQEEKKKGEQFEQEKSTHVKQQNEIIDGLYCNSQLKQLAMGSSQCNVTYDLSVRQYINGHDFKIKSIKELRQNNSYGSTLLIKFQSPIPYKTANNLAIFPQNRQEDVFKFAKRLGLEEKLQQKMIFSLTEVQIPKRLKLPFPGNTTLREVLTKYCDITGPIRPKMLNDLAKFAKNDEQKAELEMLGQQALALNKKEDSKEVDENQFQILNRQKHNILSLLMKYQSINDIPLNEIFNILPRIMPRYYTIASSSFHQPDCIDMVISLTMQQIEKQQKWLGLTSRFLLDKGFVKNSQFKLPPQIDEQFLHLEKQSELKCLPPLLMIGPGTGVAPFIGFLQDFNILQQKSIKLEYHLYFGCRKADSDFIFKEELKSHFVDDSNKRLFVAFSREEDKVYVQNLLAKQTGFMKATEMGKDVQRVIQQIIMEQFKNDGQEAKLYWKKLQKSGRFVKQLWG